MEETEAKAADAKRGQRDEEAGDAIGFIDRDVSLGRDGAFEPFSRDDPHQNELKKCEDRKDFPSESGAEKDRCPDVVDRLDKSMRLHEIQKIGKGSA